MAKAPAKGLSTLNSMAFGLAVYASQCGLPRPTQNSLPAAGQALPGGLSTHKVPMKGFRSASLHLFLPSQVSWRNGGDRSSRASRCRPALPKIGDESVKHLASFPSLERLSLIRTGVTDAGMKDLAAMPELKHLTLCDTALTDAGLMTLVGPKKLEMVNVARTKVTDAGVKAFQQARPECKVER